MCDPPRRSIGKVGAVSAVVVGGGTAVAAIQREAAAKVTHAVTPTEPVSAVSVAHSGFPWLTAGVGIVVAAAVAWAVWRWLRQRRTHAVVPARRWFYRLTARPKGSAIGWQEVGRDTVEYPALSREEMGAEVLARAIERDPRNDYRVFVTPIAAGEWLNGAR